MHIFLKRILSRKKYLIKIFTIFALAASIQSLLLGPKKYHEGEGGEYNSYNNYTIFKKSFFHLKSGQNLYIYYPDEHWDLYKYTPTFAVFFGAFALLPDWAGLTFWNLLNALILLHAIYYLPKIGNKEKATILLIILIELMTSMQNEQSNALITGLLVFTFGLLEKDKYLLATFCVVFSCFIKLFGIVGMALFLLYPNKWKLALYTLGWTVLLALVPFIFINISEYQHQLQSYWELLSNDHCTSAGYSVMGWLHSWFNLEINKILVVGIGVFFFLIPFIKIDNYRLFNFRLLVLSSILIWIVIFNHKAESPTFIIAMTGVAIWFIWCKKNGLNISLFILAFILTTLSPTDLFPKIIRNEIIKPYTLKVFPCIIIWFKLIFDLTIFNLSNKEQAIIQ